MIKNPLSGAPGLITRDGAQSPVHFGSPVASPRLADRARAIPKAATPKVRATEIAELLAAHTLRDLPSVAFPECSDNFTVRDTDSVAAASARLWARHAPVPVPAGAEVPDCASPVADAGAPMDAGPPPPLGVVVTDEEGKRLGVLDAVDILEALVEGDPRLWNIDDEREERQKEDGVHQELWEAVVQTPCGDVVDPKRRSQRALLHPDSSLLDAAARLRNRDRLPIVDKTGALWGIADTASLVGFIRSRGGDAVEKLMGSSLASLGLGKFGALCIDGEEPVAEAISLMGVTRPPLSGVAVTGEEGRLMGHFSLPHVLRLASGGEHLLHNKLKDVAACHERSTLCCPPSTELSHVVDALLCSESPAVYVVEDSKAVGAANLNELLSLIVRNGPGPVEQSDDD
eukprot:Hpha_TRINITY_DN9282_c0_g1::TRINITY_DN9282_c0_g1_i1::g.28785::m.28785